MKRNYIYAIILFQFFILLTAFQCAGNMDLTNGYEHEVIVHSSYEYNNTIINRFDKFYPGTRFYVAGNGHDQFSHVTAIRIETMDGTVLDEFSPEYIENLRSIFITRKNLHESWIFTERGLFFRTIEINRRYNGNEEKILEYYRSDEAVQDLKAMLEAGE